MTVRAARAPHARDLRELLRLSRERMARLIGVSSKTIERWEVGASRPSREDARRRLAQLSEVAALSEVVYGREGVAAFMGAPLAEHDGLSALQLIERGEADRVLAALGSDYEGGGY